jgi:isoquinoline 1-oxidoreductase beta subunit
LSRESFEVEKFELAPVEGIGHSAATPAASNISGPSPPLAPSFAAVACAYARATNTLPTRFPLNHDRGDLGFVPLPTVPPIPLEPVDGLTHTF